MFNQQEEDEPLVGVDHLAKRYSLTPGTIRKWLRSGLLPGRFILGRWPPPWDEIFAFEGRLAPPRGEAREAAKRPLWTLEKVAEHFGRPPTTVREWFRRGTFAGRKIMDEWYTDAIAIRGVCGWAGTLFNSHRRHQPFSPRFQRLSGHPPHPRPAAGPRPFA
jgi:hypothetical protein